MGRELIRNLLNEALARIRYDIRDQGFSYVLKFLLTMTVGLVMYPFYRARKRTFLFNGNIYDYFYHWYNITHVNERCVEIPIIKAAIDVVSPDNTLEVGNVLRHYVPVSHTVVDKYEKGDGVINLDIMEYETDKKFDLIVSISTIEHIGWDDRPRTSSGALAAIEKLKKMLNDGGTLIITIPIGYNPHIDYQIKSGDTHMNMYCMLKTSRDKWRQLECEKVKDIQYGRPYPYANAIAVLVYQHKEKV